MHAGQIVAWGAENHQPKLRKKSVIKKRCGSEFVRYTDAGSEIYTAPHFFQGATVEHKKCNLKTLPHMRQTHTSGTRLAVSCSLRNDGCRMPLMLFSVRSKSKIGRRIFACQPDDRHRSLCKAGRAANNIVGTSFESADTTRHL